MSRKFGGGEPFRVNHQDHNRWQDAGLAHAMRAASAAQGVTQPDWSSDGIIMVKNETDRDLPRYSILGTYKSIPDPKYSPEQLAEFKNFVQMRGRAPLTADTGKFCVLQVDAKKGEVVPAMVSGTTPCLLSVTATTDEFAEIDPTATDPTKYLKTGGSGSAQVIHQPTETGEQWGVVRLGNKPTSKQKLIRFSHLPAQYGGSNRTGIGGSAAISNGNIAPTNALIFPKLWEAAYDYNSSGELASTGESGYCVNLGSMPLREGWGLATKMFNHPSYGDIWAVDEVLSPNPHNSNLYTWLTPASTNDWTLADTEKVLLRPASGTATGSGDTLNWSFPYSGDIMLSHFGWWEVTFGYRGYIVNTDSPYYDHTTGAASAGTAHTHTYRMPTGCQVYFGVHKNFQPTVSVIGTPPDTHCEMRNFHRAHDLQTSTDAKNEYEKTVYIASDTSPWHGQFHTRLSLYAKVLFDTHSGSGTPKFKIETAWMKVRPAQRLSSDSAQGIGAGANQYPGGYTAGSGTFIWYGGGSAPATIAKDGT